MFDFCRIINNSWQEKNVRTLPQQSSSQTTFGSPGKPNTKRTFTGGKKRKKTASTTKPLHFLQKSSVRRSFLAWPTSADGSFVIQVKNKTEVGIVLILALIISQENSRAGRREKQIMVNAVT